MTDQEYADESTIAWVRDAKEVPYLREAVEHVEARRKYRPRSFHGNVVYAYAKLKQGAKIDAFGGHSRRVWYLTKGDPFVSNRCPSEGRSVSSIEAGKPSEYGRDW